VTVAAFYSPRYHIDIGLHVFPTRKYQLVHEWLAALHGSAGQLSFVEPEPAEWDELALVHTYEYLSRLRAGTLSPEEIAQLELPWSEDMVEGFRLMVGGTIEAALTACGLGSQKSEVRSLRNSKTTSDFRLPTSDFRAAVHIGGGLHHAFPNHGEGFCPLNDVAVAVRVLQQRGIERAAIVDLDVHHGNGTAFIFESDPRVFTFSMHQQHNYPMWKPRGSLDLGLPDSVRDATYLAELEKSLPQVLASRPQCMFYLAGADPYEDDQLGGLRLTREGLRQRDRMVIQAAHASGVPLVIVLAGGYALRVEDTVAIHVATIEEALKASADIGQSQTASPT
jgi:acetoin utilization deacetylase AcuC-like enzyme